MKNRKKFLNLLGIARQSGNIIIGEDKVIYTITHQNKIKFLIIASDSGKATSKKFHDKSKSHQIPICDQFNREELSRAIGMPRTVIGISNLGFAKHFNKMVTHIDQL